MDVPFSLFRHQLLTRHVITNHHLLAVTGERDEDFGRARVGPAPRERDVPWSAAVARAGARGGGGECVRVRASSLVARRRDPPPSPEGSRRPRSRARLASAVRRLSSRSGAILPPPPEGSRRPRSRARDEPWSSLARGSNGRRGSVSFGVTSVCVPSVTRRDAWPSLARLERQPQVGVVEDRRVRLRRARLSEWRTSAPCDRGRRTSAPCDR